MRILAGASAAVVWTTAVLALASAVPSVGAAAAPDLLAPRDDAGLAPRADHAHRSAAWTETRTRAAGTVAVGFDDDDAPIWTSTLARPHRSSATVPPSSSNPASAATSASPAPTTTTPPLSTTITFPGSVLRSISAYWPPRSTVIALPTYSSGTILRLDQIPGHGSNSGSGSGSPQAQTSPAGQARPVYGGTALEARALPTATAAAAEWGPPGRVRAASP